MVRFADDLCFVFEMTSDAERFFKVLPLRLKKFGLEMHDEKSQILPCGWAKMQYLYKAGKRVPTFKFLGFIFYWRLSRKGKMVVKVKARGDRMRIKLKEISEFLWRNLHAGICSERFRGSAHPIA